MAVATVPTREEFARLADPYRRELLALPLPTGLGGPSAAPEAPLVKQTDLPWLEPVPDAMVAADETDPRSPSRRGRASGWPSSPHCSTCRRGSGPC